MARRDSKLPTTGSTVPLAGGSPFAALDGAGLPPGDAAAAREPAAAQKKTPKPGMRIEIRREKAGRGGKTVTTLSGIASLDARSRERILKELKTRLGTGGKAIPGGIQIQGDCRDAAEEYLRGEGFRPVRAGG